MRGGMGVGLSPVEVKIFLTQIRSQEVSSMTSRMTYEEQCREFWLLMMYRPDVSTRLLQAMDYEPRPLVYKDLKEVITESGLEEAFSRTQ